MKIKYVLILALLSKFAWSQCSSVKPSASDFTGSTIVNLSGKPGFSGAKYILGMDFATDGRLFFVTKEGHIGLYNNGAISLLLKLDVWDQNAVMGVTGQGYESGLRGIALDPKFDENGWIYVMYDENKTSAEYLQKEELTTKLVRLSYKGGQLHAASEKTLLSFTTNGIDHLAGQLTFRPNGYLHILSGDDTDSQAFNQFAPLQWAPDVNPSNPCRKFTRTGNREGGSWVASNSPCAADASRSTANTNDFRGKTLKIKPIAFGDNEVPAPGLGTTYTVPAEGNLFSGDNDPKTLSEIYTMGHRAAFRLSVDPIENWVFVGEGGPASKTKNSNGHTRGPYGHEEYSIANKPGFFGWPYFNGNNEPYRPWDFSKNEPLKSGGSFRPHFNPNDSVKNESPRNTGALMLPPPTPATIYHSRLGISGVGTSASHSFFNNIGGCVGVAGPRYYYGNYKGNESYINGSVKLPPYFHKKWFITDTDGSFVGVATLSYNESQEKVSVVSVEKLETPSGFMGGNLLDFELGRDGSLYFAINGVIKKLTYKGSCRPSDDGYKVTFEPEVQVGSSSALQQSIVSVGGLWNGAATSSFEIPAGRTEVVVYNMKGEAVWSSTVEATKNVQHIASPSSLGNNLYYVKYY